MRRTVGFLALIGVGVSFVSWAMLIFTGACFDGDGFSIWVPIIFFSFVACGIIAQVCLAKDALRFIGRCLGLRRDDNAMCVHCGNIIKGDSKFCSNCGQEVKRGE